MDMSKAQRRRLLQYFGQWWRYHHSFFIFFISWPYIIIWTVNRLEKIKNGYKFKFESLIHHGSWDICDKSIGPLIWVFRSLCVPNCDLSCWSSSECWKRLWNKISALDLVHILRWWRNIVSCWISHGKKNMFNVILSLTLFLVFILGLGPLKQ